MKAIGIFAAALILLAASTAGAVSLVEVTAGPTLTGAGTFSPTRAGAYVGPGIGASAWFGKNVGADLEGGYLTAPGAWQARGTIHAGYWLVSLGGTISDTFGPSRLPVVAVGPEAAIHLPLPTWLYADDSRRADVLSVFLRYDVPVTRDPAGDARLVHVGLRFLMDLFFHND